MGRVRHSRRERLRVIEHFRRLGRVDKACELAGVHRASHYEWLAKYPDYREEFDKARLPVADMLEDEAVRRAVEGVERPVTVAGEKVMIREYSDRLLERLLEARRPEVFGQKHKLEHTGKDGIPLLTLADLDRIIQEPDEPGESETQPNRSR